MRALNKCAHEQVFQVNIFSAHKLHFGHSHQSMILSTDWRLLIRRGKTIEWNMHFESGILRFNGDQNFDTNNTAYMRSHLVWEQVTIVKPVDLHSKSLTNKSRYCRNLCDCSFSFETIEITISDWTKLAFHHTHFGYFLLGLR